MKEEKTVLLNFSRREFLRKASTVSAIFFMSKFLPGCKKNNTTVSSDSSANNDTKKDSFTCEQKDLTENEKNIRIGLKYVDKTPIPSRTCDNCKPYIKPLVTEKCGGCKIIPGPIHPKGYCISWTNLM